MYELVSRQQVREKDKWNVLHMYESDKAWSEAYSDIAKDIERTAAYKGKFAGGFDVVLECLNKYCDVHEKMERCYVYANMRLHEDCADSFYQDMAAKADIISTRFTEETAFIIPEILALPDSMHEFMLADDSFKLYRHFIENILRQKSHCLSDKEETLLAKASDMAAAANNIFQMFNDADIKFPYVIDENGDSVELTKGRFVQFLKSPKRGVRKDAYEKMYTVYQGSKNMLAACYYQSVKADVFYSTSRKYVSSLAQAVFDDNVPLEVYDNLINTVTENIDVLSRYVDIRKKALGLDNLYFYDIYVPITKDIDFTVTFDEAKDIVKAALAPLGADYLSGLEEGFNGGWIDVRENRGKRGGAYAWGATSVHPYVLLNFNDTIDSLFTLAHEMGHAMHSYFTWQNQPYIYAGHKIFVAEVASTVNEVLLIEYLVDKAEKEQDENLKKYLLNYYLEQFRGTFFRQTMFAEFEKITHYLAELNEPLTCETLSKIYKDLCAKYYNGVTTDEYIEMEWARIPHFYSAFYVYQYATGFSAAVAIAKKILSGDKAALESYLEFLKKGNSEYSIDLLKGAGIDMTTKEPVKAALDEFARIVEMFA